MVFLDDIHDEDVDHDEEDDIVSNVKIEKVKVAEATLRIEDIGPDDEVWTLTVPKHVSFFDKIP